MHIIRMTHSHDFGRQEVLSVFITMGQFGASVDGGSAIFLIAAVLQVLAGLWYILRRIKHKQKNANKINIKDNENDSL